MKTKNDVVLPGGHRRFGGAYAGTLLATPAVGFVGTTLAMATFDEIDVKHHTIPANIWQSRLKTKGLSDLYVQSNTWDPGGSTGWHTHPGPQPDH